MIKRVLQIEETIVTESERQHKAFDSIATPWHIGKTGARGSEMGISFRAEIIERCQLRKRDHANGLKQTREQTRAACFWNRATRCASPDMANWAPIVGSRVGNFKLCSVDRTNRLSRNTDWMPPETSSRSNMSCNPNFDKYIQKCVNQIPMDSKRGLSTNRSNGLSSLIQAKRANEQK